MDNELMTLLQFLAKKSYVTLKDIEVGIHVTKRQAMYRIEKLNLLLKQEKVSLLVLSSSRDMEIKVDTKQAIHDLVQRMAHETQYFLNRKERLLYMFLILFMHIEYVSLQDFMDRLQVSRSTVLLDLKELVARLESFHIHVKNNRKRGYYLAGSEMEIRRCMMKQVIYTLADEQNTRVFDIFIEDYHLDTFAYSRLVITELAQRHHIRFVEDRLIEFIYIFVFLKTRMQNGQDASKEIYKMADLDVMNATKEFEFTIDLLQNYKHTSAICEADQYYISAWILGISFGDIRVDTNDCIVISEIIGKIMTRFEFLSGVHYQNTEDIFIQLYSHFRPAYYRLLFCLPIFNPLCAKIKDEYRELFQLVKETMKPFDALFGETIPDDEIAYLTMHFATIYAQQNSYDIPLQKNALVVCSNGIGCAAILYNELTSMFPELHFLPPMDSSHIHRLEESVDILFTTNTLPQFSDVHIPVIQVSPVMTSAERYLVMKEVYMQLGSTVLKQPSVDKVLQIVEKYSVIQDQGALHHELLTYFAQMDETAKPIKELHLYELMTPDIMQFDVLATSWKEAIRISYQKMLEKEMVSENYIDEAIRNVEYTGPYIVITKHVAMPHAIPAAGAKKCGIGLTILREPVVFGSKDNDPVKYIFSLSATNNEAHLLAMSELIELFENPNFFTMLDEAKDSATVMDFIKQ